MDTLHLFTAAVIAYLLVGAIVSLVHPRLFRSSLADLRGVDLGAANWIGKPLIGLLGFLLYCVFWPFGWFNANKSKRALDAKFERLRPFIELHTAMNKPVRYAGGDGSSFEQAIVMVAASFINGPPAEHKYIAQHYPGHEFRRQSLKKQNGRSYDVLEFKTADGENKTLYFDISNFHNNARQADSTTAHFG
jgi:hypothetical protein